MHSQKTSVNSIKIGMGDLQAEQEDDEKKILIKSFA